MVEYFQNTQCDVLLGLFPTQQPGNVDMVAVDNKGVVEYLDIKPQQTTLKYTWGVALWTPAFTKFMHNWLAKIDMSKLDKVGARHAHGELFVGDVIQAALDDGMRVEAVQVSDEPYLDIGTPENLIQAICKHTPGK